MTDSVKIAAIIAVAALILLLINRVVFLIALFVLLDIIINYVKAKAGFEDLPFDPIAFGSLLLAYLFGITTALKLIPFTLVSPIFFGRIRFRHFLKLFTLAAGAAIVWALRVYLTS